MDILSIIGLVGAFAVVFVGIAIAGGGFIPERAFAFLDAASFALVVGPTIFSLMLMFPMKVFAGLGKAFKKIFVPEKFNPQMYITEIVNIAQDVRRNGLLSIDEKIPTYKDEFLRKGLQLAVDSTEEEMLRDIMETELGFMIDRHRLGVQWFEKGAALAPAFGMVATLIGLINMLGDMDDPDSLMANMGMAMITTVYGCLLANIVFLPIGNKLQKRSDEEVLCKQIVIEGVLSIVNGENPNQIREKLTSYIPPAMRKNLSAEARDAE